MAPAATPMMANGVESWNQPVMATRVVYMQKDEGRNAEERERERKREEKKRRMGHKKKDLWQKHASVSVHYLCKVLITWHS